MHTDDPAGRCVANRSDALRELGNVGHVSAGCEVMPPSPNVTLRTPVVFANPVEGPGDNVAYVLFRGERSRLALVSKSGARVQHWRGQTSAPRAVDIWLRYRLTSTCPPDAGPACEGASYRVTLVLRFQDRWYFARDLDGRCGS